MECFRLSREKYAGTLSGEGTAIVGARWNSKGVEMIYTAQNRSLAMAEVAVHLSMGTLPGDYVMLAIFIPDDISLQKLNVDDLTADWNAIPHLTSTKLMGDKFVMDNKYCVLQVPSAATRGDFNLLINPNHPDFKKIKIIDLEKFPFDRRIFQ